MPTPREAALALLALKIAPGEQPVLSETDQGLILDQFARVDTNGLRPVDAGWLPTYDLDAAAAEAWGIKAGMVAHQFDFGADGRTFNKADVMAHCLEMEAHYRGRLKGTSIAVRVNPTDYDYDKGLIP